MKMAASSLTEGTKVMVLPFRLMETFAGMLMLFDSTTSCVRMTIWPSWAAASASATVA